MLLVSSYERLREQATKSVPTQVSTGQHLFFQRGLAAWLADFCCVSGSTRPTPISRSVPSPDGSDPVIRNLVEKDRKQDHMKEISLL